MTTERAALDAIRTLALNSSISSPDEVFAALKSIERKCEEILFSDRPAVTVDRLKAMQVIASAEYPAALGKLHTIGAVRAEYAVNALVASGLLKPMPTREVIAQAVRGLEIPISYLGSKQTIKIGLLSSEQIAGAIVVALFEGEK